MDGSLLAVTVSDFLPLKICGCNPSAEPKGDGLNMHTPTRAWIVFSTHSFSWKKMYPISPSLMWKPPCLVRLPCCLSTVVWDSGLCPFHVASVFSSSGNLFLKVVLWWCSSVSFSCLHV